MVDCWAGTGIAMRMVNFWTGTGLPCEWWLKSDMICNALQEYIFNKIALEPISQISMILFTIHKSFMPDHQRKMQFSI
jgi:hypothetical protein